MTAQIHQLSAQGEDGTPPAPAQPLAASGSVYLDAYLAPFRQWLDRDTVTEIMVNRPGEIWVEDAAHPGMQRIEAPEIEDKLIQRLAEQVARVSHQGINREHPLLGATLPDGGRIQFCGPPATRKHWAMAIRRHRRLDLPLDAYDSGPLQAYQEPDMPDPAEEPIAFLRAAIAARKTILISGGTSTGKTTFLNAMLGEIPDHERVVLVEDTPELRLPGANGVGLVAVKGELGEAKVTANELLQSALRLRPDRIVLGELRGAESVSFLRAINTGHPGSFSTIHANSLRGALEQLALMVMQTGIGLGRGDTIAYAASVIDVIVQLDRSSGKRGISAIARSSDLL
ncbi:type IV secretion system protein VirB11 [Altererythrobacter atlanticus]|uniref:Type IV secretion system protein n=1 Tax=Croceibacterium atlanticum TaxID=1267766 RepID=A0A0F7KUC5_9SPHN|nr:P-type DNA transfer ATPase VirB11 [Croceibacterium atlanticum]AKH43933.1 Type IV secretion system protein VirB11 [Croceibacterium atlanticum]MBB5733617.1 type IV secretion system protein VirB11 [Croceibacterium atlanticum]